MAKKNIKYLLGSTARNNHLSLVTVGKIVLNNCEIPITRILSEDIEPDTSCCLAFASIKDLMKYLDLKLSENKTND